LATEPAPVALVLPAYNEEKRLDLDRLRDLAADARVRLVFVDDGSTDGTLPLLKELANGPSGATVLSLDKNRGKAEAVRAGLNQAIAEGAEAVGYYDIDLATPPAEILRLVDILRDKPAVTVLLAARVSLLGSAINRSIARHYAGRVFASIASLACGLRVYDTQCGAKLFRVTPALEKALQQPFHSRWSFDVELLSRLTTDSANSGPLDDSSFLEVPLAAWSDVPGSKLTLGAMVRAGVELVVIWLRRVRAARAA
jgi:glycosyltransferase involved in cell wall biosynthesis